MTAVALAYMWRYRRLPGSRIAAFLGGLLTVWIAIASPMTMLDHQLLTFHMVKHLLLMTVAAPLILVGIPRSRSTNWSGGWLVFFWLVNSGTVIGWHIPAAFQLALGSHAWHNFENATFMVAGLLFWLPVIEPHDGAVLTPRWSVPVYLFLATMPCDILSAFLAFCGHVVYPSYLATPHRFSMSPLDDQQFAGALMWVAVTFIYLIPAAVITIRILSPRVNHSQVQVSA